MSAAAAAADGPPRTVDDLLPLVRRFADAQEAVREVVDDVVAEQRAVARAKLRSVRARVAVASAAKDALTAAIRAAPELFEQPRTHAAHGVKFGLRKLPGRLVGDAARAIQRIERLLPDRLDELVRTTRALDKGALSRLDAATLRRIGVGVADAGDAVVITLAAGDLEKLVEALLADEEAPA